MPTRQWNATARPYVFQAGTVRARDSATREGRTRTLSTHNLRTCEGSHPPSCLHLFWTFFRIGLLTFGGGLVMIEVIRRELHDRLHWVSLSDFLDDLSIGTSLPGPFIVNLSLMTGYRLRGKPGAALATLGVVIPSFAVIVGACCILSRFPDSATIDAFFRGARPAVVAVLIHAMVALAASILTTAKKSLVAIVSLGLVLSLRLHPLWAIAISIIGSRLLGADSSD